MQIKALTELSLDGNPVSETDGYRDYMIYKLETLKHLVGSIYIFRSIL